MAKKKKSSSKKGKRRVSGGRKLTIVRKGKGRRSKVKRSAQKGKYSGGKK